MPEPLYPPIFLIGPRCSGKSTVGRFVARSLGFTLCDTDSYVAEEAGCSIADIVEREGWAGFRAREAKSLRQVSVPGTVVATGGGAVLAEENRFFMRACGIVFYLSAPLECLQARFTRSLQTGERPSLTGADPLHEFAAVLKEREILYRRTAHHSVDASVSPGAVGRAVLRVLERTFRQGV